MSQLCRWLRCTLQRKYLPDCYVKGVHSDARKCSAISFDNKVQARRKCSTINQLCVKDVPSGTKRYSTANQILVKDVPSGAKRYITANQILVKDVPSGTKRYSTANQILVKDVPSGTRRYSTANQILVKDVPSGTKRYSTANKLLVKDVPSGGKRYNTANQLLVKDVPSGTRRYQLAVKVVPSRVRRYSTVSQHIDKDIPSEARVVVCGGGAIGTSVVYHLAERGWTDVVLLEQGSLSCGTTWHSVGLVGQARDSLSAIKICRYTRKLFKSFEENGHGIGWKECGSLELARTEDRLTVLKRKQDITRAVGIETFLLTPSELRDKCAWIKTDDLIGGLWIPEDGVVTSTDVVNVYAKLAKQKGVQILEGVSVKSVLTCNGQVNQVVTSHGTIDCQYFVNCTGLWARENGKNTVPPIKVPLHANEHFYLVTNPIQGIDRMLPIIRDADGLVYFREWSGGLLGGGFELKGKPIFQDGVPDKFEFQLLPEDWDHFKPLMDEMLHRIPAMETAQIRSLVNGPETFTPDGNMILGETPEVKNYFLATGMNSGGIVGSGGVGKYIVEWIIDGMPSTDLSAHDIQRFPSNANNAKFLYERVKETISKYAIKYPYESWKFSRNVRRSPLHYKQEAAGAVFGETNSYERADWFKLSLRDQNVENRTFKKPVWFDSVKKEYMACKESVGIMDMSPITTLTEVKSVGIESVYFLQKLCSNNINQEIGAVVPTGMQNKIGGYNDYCVVLQTAENCFLIQSPQVQQTRSFVWLNDNKPEDGSVEIRNLTSTYTVLNLIGPNASKLLADVSDTAISLEAFKPMTSKVIDVGFATGVCAIRHTNSGEDGFVLYVPSEYVVHVYEVLMESGENYGILNTGYLAFRMLQIENGIASWGQEIGTHTTPFECCHDNLVQLDKPSFIGKDELLIQQNKGICRQLVQLRVRNFKSDTDIWPIGGELIYRNGTFCGSVTSVGFSFSSNTVICLGFINSEEHRTVGQEMNDFIMDKNSQYELSVCNSLYLLDVKLIN